MASTELEPLLKVLVKLLRDVTARQDAFETILIQKGIMTDQEWKTALRSAQKQSFSNQADIKNPAKVATFLETLAKH